MRGVAFVFLFVLMIVSVAAAQEGSCVDVSVNDVSPSSVGIDEEVTVGILIENCGTINPQVVEFELVDVSPFLQVKESLKKNIGSLSYANSERFIVYHIRIAEDAVPGEYIINYRLSYGQTSLTLKEEGSFTITVTGEEADLNIASIKTDPTLPYEGDTVELTLRIENFGEGVANSVRVFVDHPFQGLKQSFIGSLDPDEDGPAVLTFIAHKDGEFNFPVTISYQDDFGLHEIATNVNLTILNKKINWVGIIITVALIALGTWFVVHYFRTKRKKDTIIQQLLEGNSNHHEIKKLKKKHSKK